MAGSQGSEQAPTGGPALSYTRPGPGIPGWTVYAEEDGQRYGRFLGDLEPFHPASHIRRGRAQVAAWWRARAADECDVVETSESGREVVAWQSRGEAAQALLRHHEEHR